METESADRFQPGGRHGLQQDTIPTVGHSAYNAVVRLSLQAVWGLREVGIIN